VEYLSELEKDMLLAIQEQEDLSAAVPSSLLPHRHRHSPEPTREQMDQEQDQSETSRSGLKGPKDSSPHRPQAEEGEPQGQQQEGAEGATAQGFQMSLSNTNHRTSCR
jgi:hypothetical protein